VLASVDALLDGEAAGSPQLRVIDR